MSPLLRNILGQVKRKVDFRFMMDDSIIRGNKVLKILEELEKSSATTEP